MSTRRSAAVVLLPALLLNMFGWLAYGVVLDSLDGGAALAGLGVVAYSLGVRHAFDADHIAAIDDSARLLVGHGKRPYSLGLFFALGHSSVVFLLCIGVGIAAGLMATPQMEWLQATGNRVAALAAAVFLLIVGVMNLRIALDRGGSAPSGVLHSLFGQTLRRRLSASWQMFPVGFMFGLGLGTASEVALLGMSATAASSGSVPLLALLVLPVLFAAGMTLCDTIDSIAMVNLYASPAASATSRRHVNRITTGMTAAIALFVGVVYLAQVLTSAFDIAPLTAIAAVSEHFETLGYVVVLSYLTVWIAAIGLDRDRRRAMAAEAH